MELTQKQLQNGKSEIIYMICDQGHPLRLKALQKHWEAVVIAFRKHTLSPLDDCLYALRGSITHLTRSCLYPCFKRHDINRLPSLDKEKKKFKAYPPGYLHIDITLG